MFVGNFKSYEDEKTKRLIQKDLLQIMIDNEMENERRVRDFHNPYAPRPVPPAYKTIAERRADLIDQEKQAVNNLGTLVEFSSQEMLLVINKIRSSDIADGLFNFNSFFPQIKNRIMRTLNPKLLTPEFLAKNIIDYLRTATTSNPLIDATETANDYNRFRGGYALQDDYEAFLDKYRLFVEKLSETDGGESIFEGVELINDEIIDLKDLFVNNTYLEDLKQNITISELDEVVKLIQKYYSEQSIPDITLLATIEKNINQFIKNNNLALAQKVLDTLARRVYSVNTTKNELKFKALMLRLEQYKKEDINERIEVKTMGTYMSNLFGAEEVKGGDDEDEDEEGDIPDDVSEMTEVATQFSAEEIEKYVDELLQEYNEIEIVDVIQIIEQQYNKTTKSKLTKEVRPLLSDKVLKLLGADFGARIAEVSAMTASDAVDLGALKVKLKPILITIITAKQTGWKRYNPTNPESYLASTLMYNPIPKKGFGVRNKRTIFPEKMGIVYNNISRKDLKQQELMTQNKLNRRGRKPSITGKGIVVEIPDDTYKTFGKHIIHYPQLRDTNVLNIKYPSKSKNFTPKLVISQEYRDLIMDILERGNYTNTLLDKLGDDEREHFHKVVKGAGLMEQFKLKPQTNNKIKELGARFKVLRGQFLAGNNAPTLISELRSIVLLFIEKGIIQKQDGYDLLKELS